MSIATLADLAKAMRGQGRFARPLVIGSAGGNASAVDLSLRPLQTTPAAGTTPAAAAICSELTSGAFPLAPRGAGQDRALAQARIYTANGGGSFQIEDRLAHMGGLNGTLTTVQTVGLNLHTNLAVSNLAARIGNADYSEVEWFLEWYTQTGTTVATPTANVVFHDGTTGTCGIIANGGAVTIPANPGTGRRYKLVPTNGKFIREVTSVQLSVSTGTAGNFGVTARRLLGGFDCRQAQSPVIYDWATLGCAKIEDNACLGFVQLPNGATSGATSGSIIQACG